MHFSDYLPVHEWLFVHGFRSPHFILTLSCLAVNLMLPHKLDFDGMFSFQSALLPGDIFIYLFHDYLIVNLFKWAVNFLQVFV